MSDSMTLLQQLRAARALEGPPEAREPERVEASDVIVWSGFGMHPVGAPHHHQVFVGISLFFEDRQQLVQVG